MFCLSESAIIRYTTINIKGEKPAFSGMNYNNIIPKNGIILLKLIPNPLFISFNLFVFFLNNIIIF